MIQDGGLRKKSMRKTIDRVDLGWYAKPMQLHAWHRAKRATWAGFAMTAAGQAAIGLVLFLIGTLVFGAPFNAITILLCLGFMAGCAIGDPISFLVWTLLFVEVSGTITGVLTGSWFNLPSWWHAIAASWREGKSVSPIFVGAVPVWMFVWIMGGRGVSKAFDILVERATLKFGYDVARRFMSEEDVLRVSAYEESAVSDFEAQRHFEVTDRDGTHALIAGEQPRIYEPEEPEARPAVPASAGGGYFSLLEDDRDLNPEASRRAAAGVSMPGAEAGAPSVDLGKVDAVSLDKAEDEGPSSFLMDANLPAVPVESAPVPVQRAETPRLDARANRALQRQLSALLLSFETVMTEEELASFATEHREFLMGLSDDQQRMLDTMDGGQALIAMARQLQADNTVNFISGVSDDAGPAEDLSLILSTPMPAQASPVDMAAPAEPVAPVAVAPVRMMPEASRDDAEDSTVSVEHGSSDVMALAGALDAFLPSRRGQRPVSFRKGPSFDDLEGSPPADASTGAPEGSSADVSGGDGSADDAGAAPDPEPRPTGDGAGHPESAVGDEADGASTVDRFDAAAGAGDVAAPREAPAAAIADEGGLAAAEPGVAADASGPSSLSKGEFAFEVDEVVNMEHQPVADGDALESTEEIENMSSYTRDEVLLVRGLLAAKESAQDKARNVQDFQENHPELTVSEVVGSRSFVEVLGDHDAAAVRHSWREVQAIIAAPPSERLGREFDRLNQRGQKFLEEPHLLDRPLFNHWEQEVLRLRGSAAAAPDLLASLSRHIGMNVSIGDSMRELLEKRESSRADDDVPLDAMPVVSQKVPRREDTLRGRRMLTSMFRQGAGPRDELPMADARRPETLAIADAPAPDAVASGPSAMASPSEAPIASDDDHSLPHEIESGDDMSNERGPALGEEGFVSRHPAGTLEYRMEMAAHNEKLSFNREQREEQTRLAAIEAERLEGIRLATEAADEESRRAVRASQEEAARLEGEEKVRQAAAEREAAESEAARALAAARAAEAEARVVESRAANEAEIRSRTEVETMYLGAAKRAHSQLFSMPPRLHTPEIFAAYISYEDISSYRKGLALVSKASPVRDDPLKRNDAVGRARADTAARSLLQYEVIVGEAAKAVLARIAASLGATDDQDVMDVLEEGPEKAFVARVQNAAEAGEKAGATLSEVEKADREVERLAEGSRGMDDLQRDLREALDRVGVLADEKKGFDDRMADVVRERDEAQAEATRLRREMSGELDDEFQKVLEQHATHIDDIGVNGFYRYASADRRSCFVIITAKASSFEDGAVDMGDYSLSISDVIDFAMDKAKTVRAKPEIFYLDAGMRPHMAGRGSLIGRDAAQLRSNLNIPD